MLNLGLGVCSSFCTVQELTPVFKKLSKKYNVYPFMSKFIYNRDTRFGPAEKLIKKIEDITGKKVITDIVEIEPFGPNNVFDMVLLAPLTGNTLSKIANGITDNAITSLFKTHHRNNKPVVLSISTNDALSGNFENIAKLYNRKNIFFVPLFQDDYISKPSSLKANADKIIETIEKAKENKQIMPLFELSKIVT